ncbi:MAG: hypothetical protein HFE41_05260 [Clostridia bacterium]|nr:hypothetical protein [Clostridia bacterium]
MKVKDVIIKAFKYAGREDIYKVLENGEDAAGEIAEAVEIMLYCFSAVEDELARFYFPLTAKETFFAPLRQFPFDEFKRRPVKIIKVTSGGREIKYIAYPTYLKADADEIEVEYAFAPGKKTLDGDCDFSEEVTTEKMLAAGALAEYCLIQGEMAYAEYFEKIYRREIDAVARSNSPAVCFPPRRWV